MRMIGKCSSLFVPTKAGFAELTTIYFGGSITRLEVDVWKICLGYESSEKKTATVRADADGDC